MRPVKGGERSIPVGNQNSQGSKNNNLIPVHSFSLFPSLRGRRKKGRGRGKGKGGGEEGKRQKEKGRELTLAPIPLHFSLPHPPSTLFPRYT